MDRAAIEAMRTAGTLAGLLGGVRSMGTAGKDAGMARSLANARPDTDFQAALREAIVSCSVEEERTALVGAYLRVLRSPLAGTPDEILAVIGKDDIDDAFAVHRGPALLGDGGELVVQGKKISKYFGGNGHGMVKIVFAHGEGHNKKKDMPTLTREDVRLIPDLVRLYAPAERTRTQTTWRIPWNKEKQLYFVIATGNDGGMPRLVTAYIGTKLAHRKVSERYSSSPEILREIVRPRTGTLEP